MTTRTTTTIRTIEWNGISGGGSGDKANISGPADAVLLGISGHTLNSFFTSARAFGRETVSSSLLAVGMGMDYLLAP